MTTIENTKPDFLARLTDQQYVVLTKKEEPWANGDTWAAYSFEAKEALPLLMNLLKPGYNPDTAQELLAYISEDEAFSVDYLLGQMPYFYVTRTAFRGQAGARVGLVHQIVEVLGLEALLAVREYVVRQLVATTSKPISQLTNTSSPWDAAEKLVRASAQTLGLRVSDAEVFEVVNLCNKI